MYQFEIHRFGAQPAKEVVSVDGAADALSMIADLEAPDFFVVVAWLDGNVDLGNFLGAPDT